MKFKFLPEFKQRVIDALRSGKYPKGKGSLKRRNSEGVYQYCCLGVIADICGIEDTKGAALIRKSQLGDLKELPQFLDMDYIDRLDPIRAYPKNPAFDLAKINDISDNFEPVIDYIIANL